MNLAIKEYNYAWMDHSTVVSARLRNVQKTQICNNILASPGLKSFCNNGNILKLGSSDDCTILSLLNTYWVIHTKQVNFVEYKLCFNKAVLGILKMV